MRNLIIIMMVLLIFSCLDSKKKMEEIQRAQIENYLKSYNTFDVEGMLKDLDEAIVFENYSGNERTHSISGVKAFEQQAIEAKSYFSSREQVVSKWSFEGNTVTIDINYHAVLAIDFPNGMKAGDTLDMKGQSVFTFNKTKIIKIVDRS